MASVSAIIQKGNKKSDDTWNVNIRVWHKGKPAFIKTEHYVGRSQLKPKSKGSDTLVIKDNFVLDRISPELKRYRDWITDNSEQVEYMSAQEIKVALLAMVADKKRKNSTEPKTEQINFLKFCDDYLLKIEDSPKARNARPLRTVYHSLKDYFKSDNIPITAIRYQFLLEYEDYLKKPRKMIRFGGGGNEYEQEQSGLNKGGLTNHMRDLRNLFKRAMDHFNDEDSGIIRISHYPFKKYKVGQYPLTENRYRDIHEFVLIRDFVFQPGS